MPEHRLDAGAVKDEPAPPALRILDCARAPLGS